MKTNMEGKVMKKIFMFSILLVLGFFLHGFALAETTEGDITLSDYHIPGTIEGTGMHFEVTDSEYLNVILDSSETITLRLESVPEMVTMYIEPASEAPSTQITISGFQPSATYYKYEDNYHNLVEFTTDGSGSYSWMQDLSQSHLVFIQPRKSTKFIKDDSTGGDCTLIGTWDSVTKTCTLTSDVGETIQIDSDSITLDGNGYTITGTGTGFGGIGVYLYGGTGVTIKNLNVKNFTYGIYLYSSSNNTLTSDTPSDNYAGIYLYSSSNNTLTNNNVSNNDSRGIAIGYSYSNTLTGNTTSNNGFSGINLSFSHSNSLTGNTASNNGGIGIDLFVSGSNSLTDNIAQENGMRDLDVYPYYPYYCYNVIENTTGSGGRPIKYFYSSVNLENEVLSELILCNADYSNINNITIEGSATLQNNGLFLVRTDYSNITNTNSSNNFDGISFMYSSNNTLTNNTACNSSHYDFYCEMSSVLTASDNMCEWSKNGCQIRCTPCEGSPSDTTPPTVTVTATPNILWPSNHKMVDVRIDGSATDDMSGVASIVITVTDEYGIYNMTVPGFGSTIQLEAWREGTDKDERVYTITVVATDVAGNQSTTTITVTVPHDMGK